MRGNVNMSVCSPVCLSSINAIVLKGRANLLLSSNTCGFFSQGKPGACSIQLSSGKSKSRNVGFSFYTTLSYPSTMGQTIRGGYLGSCFSKQRDDIQVLGVGSQEKNVEISLASQSLNMRLLVSKQKILPKAKCKNKAGSITWPHGCASAGLIFGLLVCNSSSQPGHCAADTEGGRKEDDSSEPYVKFSHGKKVYTDYSVIGIPGDGRCLFRSVAHGACLRSGKPSPSENLQRELADELRGKVADEFIKRREETEWFVEGDFDTYVSQIRKPHVWGGEPELFIASHVLQMPITVYMHDKDAGGLISIAEYGQEYGKENPIRVLYHGFGHYDALEIPGKNGLKSRL